MNLKRPLWAQLKNDLPWWTGPDVGIGLLEASETMIREYSIEVQLKDGEIRKLIGMMLENSFLKHSYTL